MKGLFIGLVLGAIATWCWFQTGGKISITETKTITVTETNWVTQTETRYFNETRWITKTNEIWKTNVIDKIAEIIPVASVAPVARKIVEQPIQVVQPVARQVAPVPEVRESMGLKGPTARPTVNSPTKNAATYSKNRIKQGAKRNMDGSIKE
jgi:hypothetical protein